MLLFLVFVGSESPRWLIQKERYSEAYEALQRLRGGSSLLAARDLIHIREQLKVETIFSMCRKDVTDLGNELPHLDPKVYWKEISLRGYRRRISQLVTIPRVRRSHVAAFIVIKCVSQSNFRIWMLKTGTDICIQVHSNSQA